MHNALCTPYPTTVDVTSHDVQGGNLPTEDAVDVKPGKGDIKDMPGG